MDAAQATDAVVLEGRAAQAASRRRSGPSAVGIALIVVGVATLALRQAGIGPFDLTPRWPFFVIIPGLVLVVIATVPRPPAGVWFAIVGSIFTTIGALLLYQQSTNDWESWAYAWTLIPCAAGVAMVGYGIVFGRRELVAFGTRVSAGSGVLFLAGLWFFGAVFATGRAPIDTATWVPAILIAIGLFVVLQSLVRRVSVAGSAVDATGPPVPDDRP